MFPETSTHLCHLWRYQLYLEATTPILKISETKGHTLLGSCELLPSAFMARNLCLNRNKSQKPPHPPPGSTFSARFLLWVSMAGRLLGLTALMGHVYAPGRVPGVWQPHGSSHHGPQEPKERRLCPPDPSASSPARGLCSFL